jgi:hypothetical protein
MYVWVPSGATSFTKGAPQVKSLAEQGLHYSGTVFRIPLNHRKAKPSNGVGLTGLIPGVNPLKDAHAKPSFDPLPTGCCSGGSGTFRNGRYCLQETNLPPGGSAEELHGLGGSEVEGDGLENGFHGAINW